MIGHTISYYKITEKIGEGGKGEAYRAEDTTLKREVAIQVLPEQFTHNPERLVRFERQGQLLAERARDSSAVADKEPSTAQDPVPESAGTG